ncbi:hypothetical protein C1H46_012715 [Malus baccata]|uniref:Exostosin GT47 domain-containing protein n=1 Tax=Malus baccata TaxID=106549 RepID=A0A540MSA2_MALBA|nr:hypothetical protein C1H46_012715 [Malus baccata]
MRPSRHKPVSSLSSILVGLILVVTLAVILLAISSAFSSSSSSEITSTVAAASAATGDSLPALSSAQPQPPLLTTAAAAPAPAPAPSPAPQILAADVLQETIIQKVEGDVTNYTAKKNDDVANGTVFISGSQLDKVEASLGRARSSIREAALVRNKTSTHQDPDYVPRGPIYRNPNAFHRSYLEMEKVFKIYVYEEGEVPIFHDGPCRSIYSSEGRFIHEMEKGKMYRTKDPHKALVYFLPFSVVNMVQYIYMPETFDRSGMKRAVVDYINLISHKHPFWNRSLGADHFMLSCHDWAADVLQETIIQKVEGDVINTVDNDVVANRTVFISGSQLDKVEASLGRARSAIREAAKVRNKTSTHQDPDYVPRGPIYHNPNAFHRSYLEMEKVFKIYVYEEGEVPIFHEGPCRGIYSSEGRFIHEMEKGKFYRTKDPHKALVYFLPFSVVTMVEYIYMPKTFDRSGMKLAVIDYINLISHKHPFWNRSHGADHFMLSCHDWGPYTTSFVPDLFHNSIRILCNANTTEGFNPSKDASLPEINLKTSEMSGIGGQPPSKRSTLAFFAGGLHGHIRYLLLNEWKGKDQDVLVYDKLPKGVSYENMLRSSKFCLCPSGYEVASPRVVEAIYAECVPVLISDGYVPPFSDVLNWNSFSVQVPVKNISDIKTILTAISSREYLRMQRKVKQVQRHFLVNGPPKRYDVFHMIVHSIWLRRLNIRIQDVFT